MSQEPKSNPQCQFQKSQLRSDQVSQRVYGVSGAGLGSDLKVDLFWARSQKVAAYISKTAGLVAAIATYTGAAGAGDCHGSLG